MAKAAIAKLQNMENKRLAAAARARGIAKAAWDKNQHTMVAGVTSFGIGLAEKKNFALPTFDGVDPAVLYAAISLVGENFIKDQGMKKILQGATDGLIGVAAYKAGLRDFATLFNYTKPAAVSGDVGGWGEEIVETEDF